MKLNFQKLHVQKIKWRPHDIIGFWCVFFYVNNNKELIVTILKSCILFFVTIVLSMYLISKLKKEKA
jgi:hypothetical protein